ncbi:MAG TPA: HD domain-containing phosphohydrolase, partial [Candidatus Saccharimonadales bacterium]|nr:HD domain-containing phosphohydrolase [Candidatus Saccharimonadales bacterium]
GVVEKDETTASHLMRVRRYVEAIATKLGLPTQVVEEFPDGLGGDAIPLAARIVFVADVFDALTSKRPYKEAWSTERGIAAIELGAGGQFDPGVVSAFRELYAAGEIDRIRGEVHPA